MSRCPGGPRRPCLVATLLLQLHGLLYVYTTYRHHACKYKIKYIYYATHGTNTKQICTQYVGMCFHLKYSVHGETDYRCDPCMWSGLYVRSVATAHQLQLYKHVAKPHALIRKWPPKLVTSSHILFNFVKRPFATSPVTNLDPPKCRRCLMYTDLDKLNLSDGILQYFPWHAIYTNTS